ncbi:hypothetical protein HJFPF1_06688 [Paramyrothecium foliicola]|nr:hypothetical protein HJFPF1_06688 [Paramyrothecium foliicola]
MTQPRIALGETGEAERRLALPQRVARSDVPNFLAGTCPTSLVIHTGMVSMFEYPQAKRVRREDLACSETSSLDGGANGGLDEELRAILEAQIAKSLGFSDFSEPLRPNARTDSGTAANKTTAEVETEQERSPSQEPTAEDEGYMFRLFSTSNPVSKVVLDDDDEELQGEGGLVRGRPISYYWAKNVPVARKQEYQFAALSGDEVIARSSRRSYGLELPWKVTTITVTKLPQGNNKTSAGADTDDPTISKRRRPGKKRRIAIRTKQRAEKAKEEATAKQNLVKEEHLKEKKKRLNRLKKLRKRAKAKEMKSAAGDTAVDEDSEGDDSGAE